MDPTPEQWKQISETIKKHQLLPFFDCAYQGFASGNAPQDAAALRMFVEDGHHMALVQSFSKNFGLYGQRIGALSVVAGTAQEASSVVSQMKLTIRPMYSNPPRSGAQLVSTILSDERLTNDFIDQCKGMADRINEMRVLLRSRLEDAGSTRSWEHITKQIGMFAFSGLNKEQVEALKEKHHIYCTGDGRISMAVSIDECSCLFVLVVSCLLEMVWTVWMLFGRLTLLHVFGRELTSQLTQFQSDLPHFLFHRSSPPRASRLAMSTTLPTLFMMSPSEEAKTDRGKTTEGN